MKKLRSVMVFAAALALTLLIVVLQLAWNLRSPEYLQGVASRAGTNEAVAAALPEYASSKLPDPDATKVAFTTSIKPANIQETLDSLYLSITHAYVGKTDVVEIDIVPLTLPIKASGYQIPPGTVFANDTVQVGGLAAVLRTAQKSLVPILLLAAVLLAAAVLTGIKRGILLSLRSVLLVTCVLLGGLFVSTYIVPTLVESLVSSSGLDAGLRAIVLSYTNLIVADSGRYYISWIVVFGAVIVAMSIASSLAHRAKRPAKRSKRAPDEPQVKPKEL